jgi:hypothetical protein
MSTPTHPTLTDALVRPVRSTVKPTKTSADQVVVLQAVAITATGPIYRRQQVFALLPLSVALALTQEVASRVLYPRRQVVSSLANRVSGESARQVWHNLCASLAAPLANAPLHFRHQYLRAVLAYVWQQKNVNGIEPVLCAAINAVAPAMSNISLAPLLFLSQSYLSESEFQAREPMAILDPASRTATGFAAGSLGKLDLTKWLAWRAIGTDVGRSGDMGGTNGLLGPGQAGYYGVDLSGLQGADGQTPRSGSSGSGPSDGGLLGPGMPGYNGVDLSGLRGSDGSRVGGGGATGGGGRSGADGLLGPGQAGYNGIDLSGLRGADGQGIGTYGGLGNTGGGTPDILGEGGLLGPGSVGRPGSAIDLSNLRGNGGPFGFGPNLSAGGAADGWDALKSLGSSGKSFGIALMGLGATGVAIGVGAVIAGGGTPPADAAGGVLIVGGGLSSAAGGVIFFGGAIVEAVGAYGTPSPTSTGTPAPTPVPSGGSGTTPAPSSQEPAIGIPVVTHPPAAAPAPSTGTTTAPAPTPPPSPESDPGTPKDSDVYPDPNGKGDGKTGIWDENGGGGNPTTIWDDDQGGGGNPAAMWDEFGHGGNPNSIWDEHGGGGNPTTIWDENGGGVGPTRAAAFAVAKVLSGPGLEARLVRVGPSTMAI